MNYNQVVAGLDIEMPKAEKIRTSSPNQNWPTLPKKEVQKGDLRALNAVIPTLKANVEAVQALLVKADKDYQNYSDSQMFLVAAHSAFSTLRKVLEAKQASKLIKG